MVHQQKDRPMPQHYTSAFQKPQLLDVIEIDGTVETALFAVREIRRRQPSKRDEWETVINEDTAECWIRKPAVTGSDTIIRTGDRIVFQDNGYPVVVQPYRWERDYQGWYGDAPVEPWMVDGRPPQEERRHA